MLFMRRADKDIFSLADSGGNTGSLSLSLVQLQYVLDEYRRVTNVNPLNQQHALITFCSCFNCISTNAEEEQRQQEPPVNVHLTLALVYGNPPCE